MDTSDNGELNINENQDDGLADYQESENDSGDDHQEMIAPNSYGLLALFFGWLGIHDFSARLYKYGCIHLAMAMVALCVLIIDISNFLPPTLLLASWLWAIWEVIRFRKTSNAVHVRTQEVERRGYIIKAKITEFFMAIAIIAVATAIYFAGSSMNCSGSGCSGPGWALVLTVWIGTIPFLISIILLIGGLVSYLKMPQELKKDKTLKNHTIAMCYLGFILLLAIVAFCSLFHTGEIGR